MNQIIYLEKEKISSTIIKVFIGLLWAFSMGLILMSIYNIYDINKGKVVVAPSITIAVNNEVANNEVANNEITNNEVINNEIANNEIVNNEVTNNEIVNNEVTNNEVSKPDKTDIDNKKPTIKVRKQNNILYVIATDEGGIDYVIYNWDEKENTKLSVKSGEEIKISVPNGTHLINIEAHDSAGNVKKYTKEYDGEQPVVPTDEEKGKTSDRIAPSIYHSAGKKTVAVYDDGGIKEIQYSVNGNWYSVPLEGTPQSIQFTIQNLTEGEGKNKVRIIATDVSDNKKELEKNI